MWNSALIQWQWIIWCWVTSDQWVTKQKSKQQVSSCEKCTWWWTSGIWSKVIQHLDMWGWLCFALGLFDHLCLEPDGNSFIFVSAMDESCEHADVFFPPLLRRKLLLVWFHLNCCTLKAEKSSVTRMLARVSTKKHTSAQHGRSHWCSVLQGE